MYSVVCHNSGVLDHVSRFASRRQILVVPSGGRRRSCGENPQEGVSVRRTPALRQLPPQAAGHSRPASRATAPQTELLLRSRRLQEESDTAVGALPRAERSTSAPSSSSSAPCGKGRHHAGSASFPHASAPTGGPSPAGRSSGANTSRRHPSGRSHAPVSCRSSRSSRLPYSLVDAFLRRHPPLQRVGRSCCGFSRRSRFPGPCESRSRDDRLRPAEDARRSRFGQPVYKGCHSSFTRSCEET